MTCKIKTPFAIYLEQNPDVTAASVGRKMKRWLEEEPSDASLSQWRNGVVAPSPVAQEAMKKATGGKVRPGDWFLWLLSKSLSDNVSIDLG